MKEEEEKPLTSWEDYYNVLQEFLAILSEAAWALLNEESFTRVSTF